MFSNVTGKNDKDDDEDGDFRCGGCDSMCDGETNDDGVGEDSNDDDNDFKYDGEL